MKRTVVLTISSIILATTGLVLFNRIVSKRANENVNFAEVKKGSFEIVVSGIGELTPDRSVDIKGPNTVEQRGFRAAPLKITDIVPEGTIVKRGDYIARLDRTNFENTLKDELTKLNEIQVSYDMKLLDTALVLNTLRDEIRNQAFIVEGAEITVEQSKYEPPATQRYAEIELDKAKRFLEQKNRNYSLMHAQTSLEIRNLRTELRMQSDKVRNYQEILSAFSIVSPSDGMVTYVKDRMGTKIKTGSNVNPFNPVVATLPDLSSLKSKLYVSEIYINKIQKDQPVEVSIDAFPGKSFNGRISYIANVGEQLPNSDSKMFEIMIRLDGSDPLLRPSMTTSNKIIIDSYDNVLYIPLESVHAGSDSIPFVYTKNGEKQYVVLGQSNDKNIIVEEGLKAGTSVYLTTPAKFEKFPIAGSELIPVIQELNKERRIQNVNPVKQTEVIAKTDTKEVKSKALPLSKDNVGITD